jgi:hypothetical protein
MTADVMAFKVCPVLIFECITSMDFGECDLAASASSIVAFHTSIESGGAALVNESKACRASTRFSTARRYLPITDFTA